MPINICRGVDWQRIGNSSGCQTHLIFSLLKRELEYIANVLYILADMRYFVAILSSMIALIRPMCIDHADTDLSEPFLLCDAPGRTRDALLTV